MPHVHGRPDNDEQHLDDILGRGKGDPDVHGYPGEKEAEAPPSPKAKVQNKNSQTDTISEPINLMSI